ncbi:MAG: GHKL domain-containing protein [Holophagaceae bacterium]|nr:GHKL domain-containing protein [Holophagaceae bacterium]
MIGSEGAAVYLILGLICLIMSAITWVVLAHQRSHAAAYWCLGNLLFAGGLLLAWHEQGTPGWTGLPLANLIALGGLLSGVQALRLDQGAPWRPLGMALASLGFLLAYEFTRQELGQTTLRAGFVTLVWLLLVLQVAWWAWRIARRRRSTGAMAIAASQLLLAVGLLIHLAELLRDASRGQASTLHLLHIGFLGSVGVLTVLVSDVGFIGIILERSVRERMEAAASQARVEERQLLSNQLAQLDRQRSLGLMAASLAHELKQPLTAILASAQAARRGTAAERMEPAQSLELLDKVILNTRRISGITDRLRSFIRPGAVHSAPVDLVRITREMLELLQPDLRRHGVRVAFPAAGPQVLVQGDAIQLSQVVLNVLRNAIDAVHLIPDRSIQVQILRSDREAVLSISDSGPGLDPDLADRFGTPYFTTKDHGLGLGLSISIAILEQHQGNLTLRNAEGGGACVDIRLPLLPGGGP